MPRTTGRTTSRHNAKIRIKYCIYDTTFDAYSNNNNGFCENPWNDLERDPEDDEDAVKTWCLKHSLGGLTSEGYGFAVEVPQEIVSNLPFTVTPAMTSISPSITMKNVYENGTAICFIKKSVYVFHSINPHP